MVAASCWLLLTPGVWLVVRWCRRAEGGDGRSGRKEGGKGGGGREGGRKRRKEGGIGSKARGGRRGG